MTRKLIIYLCVILSVTLSARKVQPDIVILGTSMIERLTNQTTENADLLYNNFSEYLKMLQEINDLIWSKSGDDVIKGMAIFDELEEAGGPPHVSRNLDYAVLMEKFQWSEDNEIKNIKSLINETKVLWEAIKVRANRLRIGTWGVDSKEEDDTPQNGEQESDGELH